MCIESYIIVHYVVHFWIGINRIAGSEDPNNLSSEIKIISYNILKITLVFSIDFHTKYVSDTYYYSFCHNSLLLLNFL